MVSYCEQIGVADFFIFSLTFISPHHGFECQFWTAIYVNYCRKLKHLSICMCRGIQINTGEAEHTNPSLIFSHLIPQEAQTKQICIVYKVLLSKK